MNPGPKRDTSGLNASGPARAVLLCLAVGSVVGCTVDNPATAERDGDPRLYAVEVQPIVDAHCGFEGCHGREGMPLVLYAKHYFRLSDPEGDVDPEAPPLDERALSEGELEHNRRALAARTSDRDPTGNEVIRRLVPLSAGGIPHGDTVVYESMDDPNIAVLRHFLETVRVVE